MNPSRSFDRAAIVYDQTRPLFEPGATVGIQAILDIVGPGARLLEVGAGTGRISIPLLQRGANVIGCDLASKMLARMHEKLPSARLAQADAAALPFPAGRFDAVLTVHVMHLVGPWRQALREFRRVAKPGGVYLNARTWETVGTSAREQVRDYWRGLVAAQGIEGRHPGADDRQELLQELRDMAASLAEVEAVRFSHAYTLREEIERFETRVYSDTWSVPDAIYEASLADLRAWIGREYGSLEAPVEDIVRFAVDVAHFE